MKFLYNRSSVLLLQRTLTGILAASLLLTAVGAAAYGLIVLTNVAKEILVAVIAAAASLLSAVFAYVFQRNKELELASVQRDRELEIIQRKTMQENYTRVLEKLAPYVRNPNQGGDDFTTAHLFTWVVGSPKVVGLTSLFIHERTPENLDALLLAMRSDLALESWRLDEATTSGLFPVPPSLGGLRQHSASTPQSTADRPAANPQRQGSS
jgi:hypothetical protein